MKKKLLLSIITASSITISVNAQESEPIFVIDDKLEVYADEFWREYKQHYDSEPDDLSPLIQNYANYRLQIYDAEQRHLDTATAVKRARDYYQNYLVINHIANNPKAKQIIKQLTRDCGTQYRVSHIQVNFDSNSPSDTAAAYFKAAKIRTRLTSGADFALAARQLSDDPSANYNGGDLGYISVLEMPNYPFAQYVKANAGNNEISQPVRGKKAYHIIKVLDSRPAVDSVSVSCIEIKKAKRWRIDDSLRTLANQICDKIKKGEDFYALQKKYSYQQGSQKLTLFEAVDLYGSQINDLKREGNTYANPVETYDAFLIVRLNKLYPRSSNIKMDETIKSRFVVSDKFKELADEFLDSVKTVSGYTGASEYGALNNALDETIFDGKWIPQDGLTLIDDKLFTFGNRSYTLGDFAQYIYENQKPCAVTSNSVYLNGKIKEMTDHLAFDAAKKMLLKRYPHYNVLLHEYTYPQLYALADEYNRNFKKAENRAEIEEYYKKHASDYLSGYLLYLRIFEPVQGASPKKLLKEANQLANVPSMNSTPLLRPVVADTFQLGQNPVADIVIRGFNSGEYTYPGDKVIKLDQENRVVIVKVLEEPHPMELNQVYNQVKAEYQNTIKADYTDNLRKKYTLKISKNAETILKESY
ncbi:MAG: peptidylprolyl isomerase [Bacteroidales bacterium]|nr:peptidylprolyl isomerase [Bacteroidales bacterium]